MKDEYEEPRPETISPDTDGTCPVTDCNGEPMLDRCPKKSELAGDETPCHCCDDCRRQCGYDI